jgi:hypothetical protein
MPNETPQEIWHTLTSPIAPKQNGWPVSVLHYTKLSTFKQIAESKSIALFNSLLMNDWQEVSFNLSKVRKLVLDPTHPVGSALMSLDRALGHGFLNRFKLRVGNQSAHDSIDTYLFCCSEQSPDCPDGLLSMWRAYGADGLGAAIEFKLNLVKQAWSAAQPVVFYPVRYEDESDFELTLVNIGRQMSASANNILPLWMRNQETVLDQLYEVFFIASATRKHKGFSEEREWRVIASSRLASSSNGVLSIDVFPAGNSLRLGVRLHLEGYLKIFGSSATMDALIGDVIIGPGAHQVSSAQAVVELLARMGCTDNERRIRLCTIPYRANK